MTDDERIELAARAIWACQPIGRTAPWDSTHPRVHELLREQARAALTAAGVLSSAKRLEGE